MRYHPNEWALCSIDNNILRNFDKRSEINRNASLITCVVFHSTGHERVLLEGICQAISEFTSKKSMMLLSWGALEHLDLNWLQTFVMLERQTRKTTCSSQEIRQRALESGTRYIECKCFLYSTHTWLSIHSNYLMVHSNILFAFVLKGKHKKETQSCRKMHCTHCWW